jgi:hypothetical protein
MINKILSVFRKPKTPPATAPSPRKRTLQVMPGKAPESMPEFARNVDAAQLAKACQDNVQCCFSPKIEMQRLYRPTRDAAGNLDIEYEGISASCPPMKNVGSAVSKAAGQVRPFRYVDLNHILSCCCGNPQHCPFYQKETEQRREQQKLMRKI